MDNTLDRDRLRRIPLLAANTDDELDELMRDADVITMGAGEVVVAEGDVSDCAYLILSGAASVVRAGIRLASLEAGEFFGETALIAGGVRTATVRATASTELLRLDAAAFARMTRTQTVAWSILEVLLARLRDTYLRDTGTLAARLPPLPEGEVLAIDERVVVAVRAGIFRPCDPDASPAKGDIVACGQVLGCVETLGEHREIRSPFGGFFMEMLALPGERVTAGQPIAWLRTF